MTDGDEDFEPEQVPIKRVSRGRPSSKKLPTKVDRDKVIRAMLDDKKLKTLCTAWKMFSFRC